MGEKTAGVKRLSWQRMEELKDQREGLERDFEELRDWRKTWRDWRETWRDQRDLEGLERLGGPERLGGTRERLGRTGERDLEGTE